MIRETTKLTYRPFALRMRFLITALIFILAAIALLQLAWDHLPNRQIQTDLNKFKNETASIGNAFHEISNAFAKRDDARNTKTFTDEAGVVVTLTFETVLGEESGRRATGTSNTTAPFHASAPTGRPNTSTWGAFPNAAPPHDYVPPVVTLLPNGSGWAATTTDSSDVPVTLKAIEKSTPSPSILVSTTPSVAPSWTVATATPARSESSALSASATTATKATSNSQTSNAKTKNVTVEILTATYLPTILAAIIRIMISTIHTQLILIEPFRHLFNSRGAPASRALFHSFHRQSTLGPLGALVRGRFLLCLVGVTHWLASSLPALASGAIWVETNWGCANAKAGNPNPCPPELMVSELIVRVLQGLLGFLAITLIVVLCAMDKQTGLQRDPSSIVAVDDLIQHPQLLEDLRTMPAERGTSIEEMEHHLDGKRYKLAEFYGKSGEHCNGIMPAHADEEARTPPSSARPYPLTSDSFTLPRNPPAHRWHWNDFILLGVTVGAFGVVLAYFLAHDDTPFNRFFSSNTFAPTFILTVSATVTAMIWDDRALKAMILAPWNALAQGPQPLAALEFAPTTTPGLATYRALRHGYVFVGAVTAMGPLGEALSVVIGGVPFSTGQMRISFLISSCMSMAILGVMALTALAVIVHRWREPMIEVSPETLGVKMGYVAGLSIGVGDGQSVDVIDGDSLAETSLKERMFAFRLVNDRDGERLRVVELKDVQSPVATV